MSSADLYEDGFPHGTKEGYDRGCRGSACPETLEGGQTCATAKSRYNGDYAYRKLVDAGMTPEQIRDAEQPAKPAKPLRLVDAKPVARPKLVEPTPVAADLEQWPDDEKPAAVPDDEPDLRNATAAVTVDPTTGKTIPVELHGTHKGYWRGCRDIACPGVETLGKSCRAALNEYVGEKKRERIARAGQAVAELAAPAAVEEPADETPDLSTDELALVTAFGLHQPEPETPALAEWELELLGLTEQAPIALADSADDREVVVPLSARTNAQLMSDYDELEQKYLQLLRERLAQPARHVTRGGGRSIRITLVGDTCEITVTPATS